MEIPSEVKKWSYGITLFILLILLFIPFLSVNVVSFILESFDYYMSFSINTIDLILFSSIPIVALYLNKKRAKFTLTGLIIDNLTLILSIIIIAIIGFYFLTEHSKSINPLIPNNVIIEPFSFFWTLVIGIGLLLPFMVIRQTEKKENTKMD